MDIQQNDLKREFKVCKTEHFQDVQEEKLHIWMFIKHYKNQIFGYCNLGGEILQTKFDSDFNDIAFIACNSL